MFSRAVAYSPKGFMAPSIFPDSASRPDALGTQLEESPGQRAKIRDARSKPLFSALTWAFLFSVHRKVRPGFQAPFFRPFGLPKSWELAGQNEAIGLALASSEHLEAENEL